MAFFVEILSFILEQYFGWDEYEIMELWRTNPGRRRSIIRQIGSSLPYVFERFYSKRSIIREIGSRLPLQPIQRPHFQVGPNGLQNNVEYAEGHNTEWIMGPAYYEDDDAFSCIGSDGDCSEEFLCLVDETEDELRLSVCDGIPKETTEPRGELSTFNKEPEIVMDNTAAMKKISALEEELNKLRAQIASLVVVPPCTPSVVQIALLTSTPCTPGAPAPPPPPPPPPPPAILTPVKSVIDIIKEKRSRNKPIGSHPSDKHSSAPNMSDVLKGLGTVKLKAIERSPGGTPVRKKPIESEAIDPSTIIARALKKKFAQRRKVMDADSQNQDKENMSSFSPSPSKSPKIPQFGPHLLKATKGKRSGPEFNGRPLHLSPLSEINA